MSRIGRERDPELLEELLFRHRCNLRRGTPLDEIAEHRGRRLADRAASAVEADLLDDVAVAKPHGDRDLVSAERVLALGLRIRGIEETVVPRILVVIENQLSIQLVELGHG